MRRASLGRAVRVGRPRGLTGLPEAHSGPAFATLAGLALLAAAEPVDLRDVAIATRDAGRCTGLFGKARRAARTATDAAQTHPCAIMNHLVRFFAFCVKFSLGVEVHLVQDQPEHSGYWEPGSNSMSIDFIRPEVDELTPADQR